MSCTTAHIWTNAGTVTPHPSDPCDCGMARWGEYQRRWQTNPWPPEPAEPAIPLSVLRGYLQWLEEQQAWNMSVNTTTTEGVVTLTFAGKALAFENAKAELLARITALKEDDARGAGDASGRRSCERS